MLYRIPFFAILLIHYIWVLDAFLSTSSSYFRTGSLVLEFQRSSKDTNTNSSSIADRYLRYASDSDDPNSPSPPEEIMSSLMPANPLPFTNTLDYSKNIQKAEHENEEPDDKDDVDDDDTTIPRSKQFQPTLTYDSIDDWFNILSGMEDERATPR